ncbi:MAG: FG-GAP repeat domain-containing protein, partial [Pirellulales bacterium]
GNHWRFAHQKLPLDPEVGALAVGDFNGDGRLDLAYLAKPDSLVVRFQDDRGQWPASGAPGRLTAASRRFRIADASGAKGVLAPGDLNGDGSDDLALLGERHLYLFYQDADHRLADPVRIVNTSSKVDRLQIADLDGDGRNDFVYRVPDDPSRPVAARLGQPDGSAGAELRFEVPPVRALACANVDGQEGDELIAVDDRTNRIKVYALQRAAAKEDEEHAAENAEPAQGRSDSAGGPPVPALDSRRGRPPVSQVILHGLPPGSQSRSPGLALGDLDGDGLVDLVASDPSGAALLVFRQDRQTGLGHGRRQPGFVGASEVKLADFDGDGRDEVVVVSGEEGAIGMCRYDDGQLGFPTALPTIDVPLAAEIADADGDGRTDIVYVSRTREGGRSTFALRVLVRGEDETWAAGAFGSASEVQLPLRSDPERIVALDANQDGRTDYLIFTGYSRPPVFLKTGEDSVPAVAGADTGVGLQNVSAAGVWVGRLDRPVGGALLVAQRNFARRLVLDEDGRWQGIEQYNAPSGASIAGAAALDVDGDGTREIVLVDQGEKKLRFLRRAEDTYQPWGDLPLGGFDYQRLQVADMNGDGAEDLVVIGSGKFGVVYTQTSPHDLRELANFESELRDVRFSGLTVADLNADGRTDVALLDTSSHYVQILAAVGGPGDDGGRVAGAEHTDAPAPPALALLPAMHFKVFEKKSLARAPSGGLEPREAVAADVTGDGRTDLILLVHDRLIVYPQDDGAGTANSDH